MWCGFVYDKGSRAEITSVTFDIGEMDPRKHVTALVTELKRDVENRVIYMHHGVHYARTRNDLERKLDRDIAWEVCM